MSTPSPMEGHGAYNQDSRVQAVGSSPGLPLLKEAAAIATLPVLPQSLVIADYGCSEGKNSLAPIATAIHTLRERVAADRAISVVHTDLPENDFSTLFTTLETDTASYLRDDSKVFAFAIGRSFYEQLLPSESVTLGWSSWALQWLSRLPASIPDHLQVAYSRDATTRAIFARQAAQDWATFLTRRGCELHSGGQLVIVTMALDENGDFGYREVLDAMEDALDELVDEGLVRADEAARMAIPTVGRSRADLLQPFEPTGSFAGLVVEVIDIFAGEDHIWNDFQRDGDARRFGARWAAFSRASVFPTLAAELAGGPSDDRASGFVERMEKKMAARLASAPARQNIPLARMRIAKA